MWTVYKPLLDGQLPADSGFPAVLQSTPAMNVDKTPCQTHTHPYTTKTAVCRTKTKLRSPPATPKNRHRSYGHLLREHGATTNAPTKRNDAFSRSRRSPYHSYISCLFPFLPDVVVGESRVEHLEVRVVDVLEHQAGRLALRVADHVQELDDVGAPAKVLQDLDLPDNTRWWFWATKKQSGDAR